jgi:Fur family ferric uptake transcriptional regulator
MRADIITVGQAVPWQSRAGGWKEPAVAGISGQKQRWDSAVDVDVEGVVVAEVSGEATRQPAVRSTRQKAAINAVLEQADEFLTARDLHERLERQGERVGLATVYRSLQALNDAGEVDQIRTDDGETAYRRCSRGHHHHLVCRSCGRTAEVEGPAVEHWADKVALAHGFVDVSHTLEIFGTCAACAAGA